MEFKHETFCIVPHQITEVGPHKQPVSVPAFLLFTAHWSYHELTCFKKEKKRNNMKKSGTIGDCGGKSNY